MGLQFGSMKLTLSRRPLPSTSSLNFGNKCHDCHLHYLSIPTRLGTFAFQVWVAAEYKSPREIPGFVEEVQLTYLIRMLNIEASVVTVVGQFLSLCLSLL